MTDITIVYQSALVDSIPKKFKSICVDNMETFHNLPMETDMHGRRYVLHVSDDMRDKLECYKLISPYIIDQPWQHGYEVLLSCFSDIIVNYDAEFKTFAQIVRESSDGALKFPFFIRPASRKSFWDNIFAGCVVYNQGDLEKIQEDNRGRKLFLEMCVVASVKKLEQKTRTFIHTDGGRKCEIIGIAPYSEDGKPTHKAIDAAKIEPFFDKFISSKKVSDIFVADFAVVDGQVRLVEINSFSTSSCHGMRGLDDRIAEIISKYSDFVQSDDLDFDD